MKKLKNIKGIFFDIGWTLCQPSTHSWMIPLKALEYFTRDDLNNIKETKRKHAFKSHILTKKSTKRKRNLTHIGLVDKVDVNNVKQLLCLK